LGTSARWAGGLTAVAVVIGAVSKARSLAPTMAAAPRFVQLAVDSLGAQSTAERIPSETPTA
jgi:hypothetical protein